MPATRRWSVPLIWLPIAAWCLWHAHAAHGASLPLLSVLFVAGVLVWQLFEYCVHRFAFHFDPTGPESIKIHFVMHGWVRRG